MYWLQVFYIINSTVILQYSMLYTVHTLSLKSYMLIRLPTHEEYTLRQDSLDKL